MKKKLTAIAAAAAAIVPLTASPASASLTGSLVFECTADLPSFPTTSGSGTCGTNTPVADVNVPSSASGSLSGTTAGGAAFTVAAAGVDNFSASFDYAEGCVANEPPALGAANGTAVVTGLTGVKAGATVTATATLRFQWTRVGATAIITFTGGEVTFSDDVATPLVMRSAVGQAAFAPLVETNNTCPAGGDLKALVAGSAVFGA